MKVPRIQILTIRDVLAGKRVMHPRVAPAETFKSAPKHAKDDAHKRRSASEHTSYSPKSIPTNPSQRSVLSLPPGEQKGENQGDITVTSARWPGKNFYLA